MNNIEFLGYKPTPDDKYGMLGIATIRMVLADGKKIVLRYKKVKAKNGSEFFCSSSLGYEEMGEKHYRKTNILDSPTDDEMLMEFIRSKVKTLDSVMPGQPLGQPTQLIQSSQQTFNLGSDVGESQVPF